MSQKKVNFNQLFLFVFGKTLSNVCLAGIFLGLYSNTTF